MGSGSLDTIRSRKCRNDVAYCKSWSSSIYTPHSNDTSSYRLVDEALTYREPNNRQVQLLQVKMIILRSSRCPLMTNLIVITLIQHSRAPCIKEKDHTPSLASCWQRESESTSTTMLQSFSGASRPWLAHMKTGK
ncbi:hypothetical protein LMH87_002577 [Akanthomyces muscarius]|uniref:Uncharacterized protein n=1 Tax=Akanthomyces muscarius TaxID=2231603 RepID=A0A9W8UIP3_AKAMU|nr:hypothetical protein LMH87_002577 [Akanthomyces muscarius]KAJ4148090.1 hypothetical protein LMH87_002577 [Akanthomyces muscarius]